MAKKMGPLGIANLMGDAADKKSRLPAEGSPMEEAAESKAEAAAEGDAPKAKKFGKKPMTGAQMGAMKAKGK